MAAISASGFVAEVPRRFSISAGDAATLNSDPVEASNIAIAPPI
jgi:hypothetical protein